MTTTRLNATHGKTYARRPLVFKADVEVARHLCLSQPEDGGMTRTWFMPLSCLQCCDIAARVTRAAYDMYRTCMYITLPPILDITILGLSNKQA